MNHAEICHSITAIRLTVYSLPRQSLRT